MHDISHVLAAGAESAVVVAALALVRKASCRSSTANYDTLISWWIR